MTASGSKQPLTKLAIMKFLLCALGGLAPVLCIADCDWSEEFPILNEKVLTAQECVAERRIRIGGIEVQANIDFQNIRPDCPECNEIWSVHSPDGKTAVVFISNRHYERNAWVIDRVANKVQLFIDHYEGRHFIVRFDSNRRFRARTDGVEAGTIHHGHGR